MGMLIEGCWRNDDTAHGDGEFRRPPSAIAGTLPAALPNTIAAEPGRFCLIASLSCPWSHRTTIVCALKGLGSVLPLHIAGGPRLEGYALAGGNPWRVPGCSRRIAHLHELYTLSDPAHSGRATVPVLWDSAARHILSNDSGEIMRLLGAVPSGDAGNRFTLAPACLRDRIDALNGEIHERLNNGVYRAGFATVQPAYDDAVHDVFAMLDRLEARLGAQRFLFGNALTESDWRLFTTLVRFDAVYAVLFKCCLRRLVDYPNLWAYARDLYSWPGIDGTVDFNVMREQSYLNDQGALHPIVAVMPATDWSAPHDRERLGPARLHCDGGDDGGADAASLQAV